MAINKIKRVVRRVEKDAKMPSWLDDGIDKAKRVISALVGLFFAIYACKVLIFNVPEFRKTAQEITGTVEGFKEKKSREKRGSSTYAPIFSYQNEQGETLICTSRLHRYPPSYEKGDQVTLLMSPDGSVIKEPVGDYWLVGFLVFGALVCFILAFVPGGRTRVTGGVGNVYSTYEFRGEDFYFP